MAANAISILIQAKDQGAASLFRKTGSAVDALTGNVRSNHESIEKANSSWLKTGAIVGAAAGVVSTVANRAFSELNNLIGSAVSRVDTLNNFPRIMSNFGVSAEDANKMIKELDLGVRGLPTSLNDIVLLAQGFVPMTKNTEEATKTALALNNAILAGGAPAQVQAAAYEQFRQALAKGKPELEDWKALETAMPAQLLQVIDKLNIGSGALSGYKKNAMGLYDAMKDGKLNIGDFNLALRELNEQGINGLPNLQQQAKNATQGIATGFQNAQTAAVRGVGAIIQAIGAENISNAFTAFGKGVETALRSLADLVKWAKQTGDEVGQYLGPKLDSVVKIFREQMIPAIGAVIDAFGPTVGKGLVWAIGAVIDIMGQAMKVAAPFLNHLSTMAEPARNFAESVKTIGTAIAQYLVPKFQALFEAVKSQLIPAFMKFGQEVIAPLVTRLGAGFVGAVGLAIDVTTKLVGVLGYVLSNFRTFLPALALVVGGYVGYRAAVLAANAITTIHSALIYLMGTRYVMVGGAIIAVKGAVTAVTLAQAAWNTVMNLGAGGIGILLGAVGGLITMIAMTSATTDNETTSVNNLNRARQQQIDLAQAAKDKENELRDASLGVEGANLRVEHATKDYNDAVAQYGPNSLQARDAAYQLKQANNDLETATSTLTDKQNEQLITLGQLNTDLDKLNGKNVTYTINGNNVGAWKQDGQAFFGGNFATGTPYSPGGLTLVGERGPELVQMPAGAKVTQAYRTRQELSQSAGVTINEHGTYIFNNQQEWDAQEARRDQTARLAMKGMA